MADNRPILFSVAHSSKAQGAKAPQDPLWEYFVSLRASLAAFRNLAGEHAVELFDVGPLPQREYDDAKVETVNRCKPRLAIEIHCNSGPPSAEYSEVIYHAASQPGREAAEHIAKAIGDGFKAGHHKDWQSRGARANTIQFDKHLMFFIQRTQVPCVLVEGLFISNPEQAAWLASDGGCEAYGLLVAAGVREWIKSQEPE